MVSYGFLWISMDSYGVEVVWVAYGFLWLPMDSYDFLWIPMDFYGFLMQQNHMKAYKNCKKT